MSYEALCNLKTTFHFDFLFGWIQLFSIPSNVFHGPWAVSWPLLSFFHDVMAPIKGLFADSNNLYIDSQCLTIYSKKLT